MIGMTDLQHTIPADAPTRRKLLSFLAISPALALVGCGRVRPHFKLTLVLETPDGVKSGSSVVERQAWDRGFPIPGFAGREVISFSGEALYVDLGNRRPRVALLTYNSESRPALDSQGRVDNNFYKYWSIGPSSDYVLELYGETRTSGGMLENASKFARYRGPRDIPLAALPDLVTFADVGDPKTVIKVDPNKLDATLGSGVRWLRTTLELTDEPVTTGIRRRLPWLENLRGSLGGDYTRTFADLLSSRNFFMSGE